MNSPYCSTSAWRPTISKLADARGTMCLNELDLSFRIVRLPAFRRKLKHCRQQCHHRCLRQGLRRNAGHGKYVASGGACGKFCDEMRELLIGFVMCVEDGEWVFEWGVGIVASSVAVWKSLRRATAISNTNSRGGVCGIAAGCETRETGATSSVAITVASRVALRGQLPEGR